MEHATDLKHSKHAVKNELFDIQKEVRSLFRFVHSTSFYESFHKLAVDTEPEVPANCEAYAGVCADLLQERGYRAYIATCSYHVFTIAVDANNGIHLINADSPSYSRYNLEDSQEQKMLSAEAQAALLASQSTIIADTYPRTLGAYDVDEARWGYITTPEWLKYHRKTVGILAWPEAKKYLLGRSIVRAQLDSLANSQTYDPHTLEAITENYASYADIDVDCDRSIHGSFAKPFLAAVANQAKQAPNESALNHVLETVDALVPIDTLDRPPFNTAGQKIIKADALLVVARELCNKQSYCSARTVAMQAQLQYLLVRETPHINARLDRVNELLGTIANR